KRARSAGSKTNWRSTTATQPRKSAMQFGAGRRPEERPSWPSAACCVANAIGTFIGSLLVTAAALWRNTTEVAAVTHVERPTQRDSGTIAAEASAVNFGIRRTGDHQS